MIEIFLQDLKKTPPLVLKFLKTFFIYSARVVVIYLGGPIFLSENIPAVIWVTVEDLCIFVIFGIIKTAILLKTEPNKEVISISGYWLLSIITTLFLIRLIEYYVKNILDRKAKIRDALTGAAKTQPLLDIWSPIEIIESKEKPRPQLPKIWEAKIC